MPFDAFVREVLNEKKQGGYPLSISEKLSNKADVTLRLRRLDKAYDALNTERLSLK